MKKILMIGMMFLVLISSAFANNNVDATLNSNNLVSQIKEVAKVSINGKEINFEVPKGLEKAQIRVRNEEAAKRIEANLNRFREKHQERLQNCEGNCVIELDEDAEGRTTIKKQKTVRLFGLINLNAEENFTVDNEGEIINVKKSFAQRLIDLKIIKEV